MSVEAWYLQKALQCSRLAGTTTDARERFALAEEAERWREIASDIAERERSEAPH
jgi:hypothetical protein